MSESYKNHKFPEADILWMKEVFNTKNFDPKVAKVKLRNLLPKGFNPKNIDSRFLIDGKNITLLGLWHVDPQSPHFNNIEKVILSIRDLIIENPGIEKITSEQISTKVGLSQESVEIYLSNIGFFGKFFNSAQHSEDSTSINIIGLIGDEAYDAYLDFESIDQLLQETYIMFGKVSKQPYQYATVASSENWVTATTAYQLAQPAVSVEDEIKKDTAFILMAMDPNIHDLVDVYHTIKDVCATFGIKAYRADEIEHQERITDLILNEIESCEFLIADLSYERPNVYYEIGYAHALDKRPILYRKFGTRLHFDLSVHNVPEYKNVTELKELLIKRFEAILGRSAK
jgi:nucleoside 2-deoxyribosyltransferase